jgi:hypothetical protein
VYKIIRQKLKYHDTDKLKKIEDLNFEDLKNKQHYQINPKTQQKVIKNI